MRGSHTDKISEKPAVGQGDAGLGVRERSVGKEVDLHAWLLGQAAALRSKRYDAVEWEALAEELEAMAAKDGRELTSRLRTLLAHLLKWRYQTWGHRSENSWKRSIIVARQELSDLFDESPSLKTEPALSERLTKDAQAWSLAGTEMGLDKRRWEALFSKACPWPFEQVMDEDDLPNPLNSGCSRP
jgi:uncharacterized protein DUF29